MTSREHEPYPATRTVDVVDDYFGTAVPDPYRWLEDSDGDEAQAWLVEQGAVTRSFLDSLASPADRAAVTARVDALAGLARRGVPHEAGGRYFRRDNTGTQQDVLVVASTPFGDGEVLLDPNPLTADSTTSLAGAHPSPDGRRVAYSWSESGSDWLAWRVRDVSTGEDGPDQVRWAKFTPAAWLPDGSGFVYGGFAAPSGDEFTAANVGHTLRLHRLASADAASSPDEIVLTLPDEPDINFELYTAGHHRFLIVTGAVGTEWRCRVWIRDWSDPGGSLRPVVTHADATWTPVGEVDGRVLFVTDLDAPLGRLVSMDPADGSVTEVVGEGRHALQEAVRCGSRLVLHHLADATSTLTVHELDGTEVGAVTLPERGSVLELEADDAAAYATFASFTRPPSALTIDASTSTATVSFTPSGAPDAQQYVTDQVWVTSQDGTRLPMFLVHRHDVTPATGPHPALLYGYGGFRIPMAPHFNVGRFAVVEAGGVLAVPNLRGGGEYGGPWHDAGRLANKQNVFDDAVAAARHLVDEGWTDTAHLAATGGSNGGLLAGALLTQQPSLFAAVIPEVGVLDLLRFMEFTIGWAWVSDYGDARRSEAEFAAAYAYSPYHRIDDATGYPPTLVMTSDHDDRVVPAHSMKFAARLQAAGAPLALLRVETAAGHGAGRARSAVARERADVLLFLARFTGLDVTRLARTRGPS